MNGLAQTINWILFSVAFVFAMPNPADAEATFPAVSYQVTEVGRASVAELDDSAFIEFRNGQSLGFIDNAVWLRIELPAVHPNSILLIRPVHIDRVEVFSEAGTKLMLAGDTVTSPETYAPAGYSLELAPAETLTRLYVKLQSQNVLQPVVTIEEQSQILRTSFRLMIAFAISLAVSLFYLAWAVSSLVTQPNRLIILFALRLVLFIATINIHSGIIRYLLSTSHLPPQDFAHNLSALIYISVAQIFDYALLSAQSKPKMVRIFLQFILAFTAAKLVLFFNGQITASLQINNLSVLGSLLFCVTSSIALWLRTAPKSRQDLALSPLALLAYFTLQLLPVLGVFALASSGNERYGQFIEFTFLVYAIIPGGFMVFALARQQRHIANQSLTISQKNIEITAQRDTEIRFRNEIAQLLNTLTHEIKTPLATLKMANATGQLNIGLMNTAIGSIESTLSQVERVERLEAGGTIVDISSVDVCSLLRSATINAGSLQMSCPPEFPSVLGDPALLGIVIKNLLENAVNYTDEPNSIEISARAEANTVEILISNQVTRPLCNPERLGEKYFRDKTGLRKPGSGLGLYIARSFTRQMGGALDFEVDGTAFMAKLTLQKS
ncbi:ATP-binding protein [Rhodobacteraceae bacterium XHP0102]|nr:ATP-binding protein [Rhodobacteraceae bacterium XHP0102]